MKKSVHLLLTTILLIGLPLAGVLFTGKELSLFLEFPPRTIRVEHAPFSWPVFIGLSLAIVGVMAPFLWRIAKTNLLNRKEPNKHEQHSTSFPWWGWMGAAFGVAFWVLAWNRFDWFAWGQRHTFTPLWIAYIILTNALTYRRTGRCLLLDERRFFILLFPASAGFWWFFEYLNRFVQNWWYTLGEGSSAVHYFTEGSLAFSTVLPAILSTAQLLKAYPQTTLGFDRFIPIKVGKPKLAAALTLALSSTGLLLIGSFPDQLFPLLWVAPLLLIMAIRVLLKGHSTSSNEQPYFAEVARGDWRRVYRFCLAALICGFFWELWNWHSLSKWIYAVPYVNRYHLFEMPILGYAGYLPFGLECAVLIELIFDRTTDNEE